MPFKTFPSPWTRRTILVSSSHFLPATELWPLHNTSSGVLPRALGTRLTMLYISKIIWKKKISSIVQDQVEPLLLCRALLTSFIQKSMYPLSCAPQHHAQSSDRTVLNGCPIRKTKSLNYSIFMFLSPRQVSDFKYLLW